MKILKIVSIVVGVLIVVIGALLAYVAATFDPNAYKPQIIHLVQERTQRTLTLDGDIKLAFWPGIGADLGKLSLSERNSKTVFAAVDGVRVMLKLMPLLSKQLVVDDVTVRGARVNLVRNKSGGLNIDDLAASGDEAAAGGKKQPDASSKPSPTPPKSGSAKAPPPAQPLVFDIQRVVVADAALNFRDDMTGARYAISKLNLKTGRLANAVPADVALSLAVQANQPNLNLALDAKTRLTFDLEKQSVALQNLALELRGTAVDISDLALKVGGSVSVEGNTGAFAVEKLVASASGRQGQDQFDVKVDAPRLKFAGDTASGEQLLASVRLVQPAGATNASLKLAAVTGSMQAFKSAAMTLDVDSTQGDRTVKATLSSPLSGNPQARRFSLPQINASINATGPDLPGKAVSGALSGSASADLTKEQAQVDLAGKVAGSGIKLRVGVQGFSPPGITFAFDADQLDIDKLLPPPASGGGAAPAAASPEQPFDLTALRTLRLNGTVRIGALTANNIKATSVHADLKADSGRVAVNPLSANLYQGTFAGAATVNAAPATPGFAVKANLAGISVAPLLKDLANNETLEGKGNVALDLTTQGNTVTALKRALNGTSSLRLTDGAVKGIDIAASIRNAKARIGGLKGEQTQAADAQQKTDFSELTATFKITNGVARNNDLSMKSPLLRVTGAGEVNIGADTINYLVKASIVGTTKGQGGRDVTDLRGITVPVRITGAFKSPSYKLDFQSMIADSARQKVEEAVKSQLQERLLGGSAKPGADTKSGSKDGLGDALKGLFGR